MTRFQVSEQECPGRKGHLIKVNTTHKGERNETMWEKILIADNILDLSQEKKYPEFNFRE